MADWIEPASVNLIVTSPPYAMMRRDQYGGIEPDAYPSWWMEVMAAVDSVLAPGGSMVVNWKAGRNAKRLLTWDIRTVVAMEDSGWAIRDEWIWHKPNPCPGRYGFAFTNGWERILHLTRATEDPGIWHPERVAVTASRNRHPRGRSSHASGLVRSNDIGQGETYRQGTNVLTIPIHYNDQRHQGMKHPARFPKMIPRHFVLLLSNPGDLICDPFSGSGTTLKVAVEEGRRAVGVELKYDYYENLLQDCMGSVQSSLFGLAEQEELPGAGHDGIGD